MHGKYELLSGLISHNNTFSRGGMPGAPTLGENVCQACQDMLGSNVFQGKMVSARETQGSIGLKWMGMNG